LETVIPPGSDPRDIDFEDCGNEKFKDIKHCSRPICAGDFN